MLRSTTLSLPPPRLIYCMLCKTPRYTCMSETVSRFKKEKIKEGEAQFFNQWDKLMYQLIDKPENDLKVRKSKERRGGTTHAVVTFFFTERARNVKVYSKWRQSLRRTCLLSVSC
jgi:hypothetical protein